MTFKTLLIAAGLMTVTSFSATAMDITIEDNLTGGGFSYIGKAKDAQHGQGIDVIGGDAYEIYSMVISRTDAGIMTVTIDTNFVDYNTQQNINFGDLFMSTTGWNPTGNAADGYQDDNAYTTGTTWDYVYDLNGARNMKGDGSANYTETNTTSARLRELAAYDMSNPADADNFKYGTGRRTIDSGDHLYLAKNDAFGNTVNAGGQHDVSININPSQSYLQFVFDVSGTALHTADQIAFHWAMSCANDIIEGEANFNVPEPAALGLLILGLTGVAFTRRRRQAR